MRRPGPVGPITGTHVYTYLKCPRAVALDLHGDPELRRAPSEAEELALRRGREHEARILEGLDYATPRYPERDFAAGTEATLALLRAGVVGVSQGVLRDDTRLGIPDLLRREPGASALGDWHYVVGDVKSSRHARADQILQVAFYSELLALAQGRAPAYAYLLLKDGREERFALADFAPVIADVIARVLALRGGTVDTERPFLQRACSSCRWSVPCLAELEARDDLSLLHGMTRGLRSLLEAAGCARGHDLAATPIEPLARRTHLDATLLRRLRRASEAQGAGRPLLEPRGARAEDGPAVLMHLLLDPFAERVLWLGMCEPESAQVRDVLPAAGEELGAFRTLLAAVPPETRIWHYGETLPRWHAEVAPAPAALEVESRLVDLAQRLRGAAMFQAPVFGLEDHVRMGLGRDPRRAGDAAAAAVWNAAGARERIAAKGRSDLADLVALKRRFLDEAGRASGWT